MKLIDFILSAKKSGYTKNDTGKELKFEDGSKGFQVESQEFRYVDKYYGFNPFSGSEKIFNSAGELIWRMNYHGKVLENCQDPNAIYFFLREAMSNISSEYPFRGSKQFVKNGLVYKNLQNGTLDLFFGCEQIFEQNNSVYILHYHGGRI